MNACEISSLNNTGVKTITAAYQKIQKLYYFILTATNLRDFNCFHTCFKTCIHPISLELFLEAFMKPLGIAKNVDTL